MIDQTISHYRVIAKVGAEGMGTACSAEDDRLKYTVAAEFFPPGVTHDAEGKEPFIREPQAVLFQRHFKEPMKGCNCRK